MIRAAALSRHLGRPARSGTALGRLLGRLALLRSRRRLAELDGHRLRDLGLTAEEARREAARPVWDAPDHWLR